MRIKNVGVCALIAMCAMTAMGCGSSSPRMLHMPEGADVVSQINFSELKNDLKGSKWNMADMELFDGIFDYRLPDMIVYRYQDTHEEWKAGLVYHGEGDSVHNAQCFFDERAIWVILFSDINPMPQIHSEPPSDANLNYDHFIKIDTDINGNDISISRKEYKNEKMKDNPSTGDTEDGSNDTIGYKIHRTSLAYTKPIGDIGLSSLISIAASALLKTGPPTDQPFTSLPDTMAILSNWRTLSNKKDTIYYTMQKFSITPGTMDRISITPTIIRNGIAASDDVGTKSNLFTLNNTFEDADPSRMNIGVGIGMTGGSPRSIGNYPTTNAYILANFFFDRPMLPLDNRSWGPVVGLGLTSGVFNRIFLGGQASVSALLIGVPAGLYDQINFPLIIPAVRWMGRDWWGGGKTFFDMPIDKLSKWQLRDGFNTVIDFSPILIPLATWFVRISSGVCMTMPIKPIFRNDWWYLGPGAIRIMAGGDYGAGRNAQCLIGLSYDL
jgi:hypothetical protein